MKKLFFISFASMLILFGACKSQKSTKEKDAETIAIENYMKENKLKAKPTESGLYYIETQKGTGEQAKSGDMVSVHYTGKLMDGTVFDSSVERGEPIDFQLGAGRVIKGWDEGIALMKVGGKGILIIPSKLGYGSREIPGVIPANSILIFDVELVEVK